MSTNYSTTTASERIQLIPPCVDKYSWLKCGLERLTQEHWAWAARLALLGEGKSPKGLLPPRYVEGVHYVRISQHPNFITKVLSQAGTALRLERGGETFTIQEFVSQGPLLA